MKYKIFCQQTKKKTKLFVVRQLLKTKTGWKTAVEWANNVNFYCKCCKFFIHLLAKMQTRDIYSKPFDISDLVSEMLIKYDQKPTHCTNLYNIPVEDVRILTLLKFFTYSQQRSH